MASGSRLRINFLDGVLSAAATDVATTLSSAEFADLPAIVLNDAYVVIVLDNEVVYVTEHTAAATTVTVERGVEGTTAVAHGEGAVWSHSSTARDFIEGYTPHIALGSSGAATTLDVQDTTSWEVTLDADCTFTFSGADTGGAWSFVLILVQDATGGRTVTWPASVLWDGGTAPTLTTTAAAVDVLTFMTVDGGTTWYGFPTGLNMA